MKYFDSVLRDYVDNATFKAKKAKVLIIDDSNKDYSLQRDLLKLYEIKADTLSSDSAYVNLIMKEKYDVIFVDCSVTHKDFMDVAEDIRNIGVVNKGFEQYTSSVPIVVVIGKNATSNKKVVLGELIDDFMVKPMEVYYLDRMLRKWIPSSKREKKKGEEKNEATQENDDKIEIPGLNMSVLYKSSGYERKTLLQKLVVIYYQAMQKAELLSDYINKGDYANYIEQMKYLKMFAKECGAETLYEMAKVHQIAGLAGNYEFIEERFPNIYECISSIAAHIEMCLKDNTKSKRKKKKLPISEHECKNEMLVALSYIDNIMPNAAVKILGKLLTCELPTDWESAVISVVDYIEDMEYERAMMLLKECLVN